MQKNRVVLFDFDGTMIKGDSIAVFVRFCFVQGVLSFSGLLSVLIMTLLWKMGFVAVEKVKSLALSPLRRMDEASAQAFCKRFIDERLVPCIFPEALAQIRRHAKAGHIILLVSASPLCYLQYISNTLPFDGIIGTRTDGNFQVIKNVVREEKKRQILLFTEQHQIAPDWKRSFSYGDSANDLVMLHMTGYRFLINPKRNARRQGQGIPVKHWGKIDESGKI